MTAKIKELLNTSDKLTSPVANYYTVAKTYAKNNRVVDIEKCAKDATQHIFKATEADTLNNFAALLCNFKLFNLASKFLKRAVEIEPQNTLYLYNAAICFKKINELDLALSYINKALKIEESWKILYEKAVVLSLSFRTSNAIHILYRCLEIEPENDETYSRLANFYQILGNTEKSLEMAWKAIEKNDKNCSAYYMISISRKFKTADNKIITQMELLLKDKSVKFDDKLLMAFALGKIYGDIKDYKKSFAYYKLANSKKSSSSNFKINNYIDAAKRHCNVFNANLLKSRKNHGNKSKIPIFIIGMPRSGTTLTEQIISCHSMVHGGGEINVIDQLASKIKPSLLNSNLHKEPFPECLPYFNKDNTIELSNNYLAAITKEHGNKKKVTNKMPENFLQLGFISFLFPNAKIINCKRHPLDVFLSIYFQFFAFVPYSFNESNIIQVYKIYHQMMKYWHKNTPNEIYDSYYEELVLNQEQKSRDLINYCGLKWEKQCLDFHKKSRAIHTASYSQVRKKLYTDSLFKWKKYEEFIEPVKLVLQEEIAEYEEELNKRIDIK
jgi:tetratricopeptide (TPR) repeat protein